MDYRKIESGKFELHVNEYNLVMFVRELHDSFRPLAEERNLNFSIMSDIETIKVWFDKNVLDKIIFNALSNSFKFTSPRGNSTDNPKRNQL